MDILSCFAIFFGFITIVMIYLIGFAESCNYGDYQGRGVILVILLAALLVWLINMAIGHLLGLVLLFMALANLFLASVFSIPKMIIIEKFKAFNFSGSRIVIRISIIICLLVYVIIRIFRFLYIPISAWCTFFTHEKSFLLKAFNVEIYDENVPYNWSFAGIIYSIPAFFSKNFLEYLILTGKIAVIVLIASIIIFCIARIFITQESELD